MSIANWRQKIKAGWCWLGEEGNNLFIIALLVLTGTLGFGLGRLSKIDESREPIRIEQAAVVAIPTAAPPADPTPPPTGGGGVVGSKNGSKYHLAWCPGAKQIKPENLVVFASRAEAERAGYSPAANCPGL